MIQRQEYGKVGKQKTARIGSGAVGCGGGRGGPIPPKCPGPARGQASMAAPQRENDNKTTMRPGT